MLVVFHGSKVYNVKIRFLESSRQFALGTGLRGDEVGIPARRRLSAPDTNGGGGGPGGRLGWRAKASPHPPPRWREAGRECHLAVGHGMNPPSPYPQASLRMTDMRLSPGVAANPDLPCTPLCGSTIEGNSRRKTSKFCLPGSLHRRPR